MLNNASHQISYPGGEVRKVTNVLLDYHDLSLTADSGSMVTIQEDRISNIWSAPDGDASRARQLTHGSAKFDGSNGVGWTPDGKVVYTSGTVEITTNVPQGPRWMPDGHSIAYIVTRNGVSNIWSMPIGGGAPKQLTNFTTDQIAWFDLSRDGKPTLFSRGSTNKDVVLISGFRK